MFERAGRSKIAEKTNESKFEYFNIADLTTEDVVQEQGYMAYYSPSLSGGHTFMQQEGELKYPLPQSQTTGTLKRSKNVAGWKLHIAIEDSGDNLSEAWGVIVKKIIEHKVCLTKIIRNNVREALKQDPQQCGKEITIYAFREARPTDEWEKFITEVTEELAERVINPGPLPNSDTAINGSNYFSYRYEGNVNSAPVDPFASIQIDSKEQQPPRSIAPMPPQRDEHSSDEEEVMSFSSFNIK
jgi:hypothetical protein